MRILVIAACPLPWPRGTPIRVHRMAEALSNRGLEVHVATYPLGDQTFDIDYHLHRVDSSGPALDPAPGPSATKLLWLDPQLIRLVRRLLARQRFDAIHAHHYEGLISALLARRSRSEVPIVYDAHTLLATELPHYRLRLPSRLISRLGGAIDLYLPRRADHLISVTRRMRDWFRETAGIPPSHLSLIPNGVEHDHFGQHDSNGRETRSGDGNMPLVVYSGNLASYQGIGNLFKAFAKLRGCNPQARLLLVTDSDPNQCTPQLRQLGIETAVDAVSADYDRLPMHLGKADVLVNPRMDCDGIPQKLLNYMAAGKPIVSFAGSASVLHNERTGLVVADGDVDAFANAISRILGSPRLAKDLGAAARREAEEYYSWKRVAKQVESVYRRVIERRANS